MEPSPLKTQEYFDQTLRLIYSEFDELWELARQYQANYVTQAQLLAADNSVAIQPGLFSELDQHNQEIFQLYQRKIHLMILDLAAYDAYCEYNRLAWSESWEKLAQQIRRYSSGPSAIHYYYACQSYGWGSSLR